MDNTYQKTTINGFTVEVFTGYDGVQLFVTGADGIEIYAHRVSGDPLARAREVIGSETGVKTTVAAPRTYQPVKSNRICLNERQEEFAQAILRGLTNEFAVWEDFEIDTFVCRNNTNNTEYLVKLETIGARTHSSCTCRDFEFRKHICKHIAQVLQTRAGICSVA